MRNPTQQEVVDAVNHGVLAAQKMYAKAYESHIFNSQYCPEYFMTVHVFQSLFRLKRDCGCTYGLSLERRVREIISHLPSKRGRYSGNLRVNGKCDLLIWDIQDAQQEKPFAAVELKEDVHKYQWDVRRLVDLVQRDLPFGIFASCQFKEVKSKRKAAEVELDHDLDSMYQKIRRYLRKLDGDLSLECNPGDTQYLRLTGDEYRLVWCPVSLVISRKRNCR